MDIPFLLEFVFLLRLQLKIYQFLVVHILRKGTAIKIWKTTPLELVTSGTRKLELSSGSFRLIFPDFQRAEFLVSEVNVRL